MPPTPLILGHRGASAVTPENTLAAFSRAMHDGADGIEFDVRLSRDQLPVVIHDATLKRTGLIDRAVGDLTTAELAEVDVGSWFAGGTRAQSFATEHVPTLAQVFELFSQNSGVLYVEMKCNAEEGAALAAAVVNEIKDPRIANRVVVESFELEAIAEVKRIDAGIRTAALFEPRLSKPIASVRRLKMIDLALAAGADEIALHHTLVSQHIIDKAKQEGLETVIWTVDDPQWISRCRVLGIKALITNDPATMVQHRSVTC
ncbi:MAG TPA: glycerophosphodiester phosphodiesterase family protein [Pyrinomonadaceae bacterium]|jgi:glycerophosphoryl diester phosphodiesterase